MLMTLRARYFVASGNSTPGLSITLEDHPDSPDPGWHSTCSGTCQRSQLRPTYLSEANMAPNVTSILVPTDFSEAADAALEYARLLAHRFGASLHLLHAVNESLL